MQTTQSQTAETYACARDRHLFAPGPKRILALDGGGVRGAITVAFLERIEQVLAEQQGRQVRLGDWFNLVGGTSTGAVIAGALALGYKASDVEKFYTQLAPRVFQWSLWKLLRMRSMFDSAALQQEIDAIVKDRTLDSEDLITGLCVVTKRMDTGSPWVVSNNPKSKYWDTPPPKAPDGKPGHIGNRYYRLANLVRASTAAPAFFEPELLPIVEGEPGGLFVDGGVTPHNNPALMLVLMALQKPYQLNWTPGPDQLLVVSVGTGGFRDRLLLSKSGRVGAGRLAFRALLSLMNDSQTYCLAQLQWMGECLSEPWWINDEIGSLCDAAPPHGKLFRFIRYDVRLEVKWIAEELGQNVSEADVVRYRAMDNPAIVADIYALAKIAAEKQVKPEHWTAAAQNERTTDSVAAQGGTPTGQAPAVA
jgi:hypothetical protein